MWVPFTMPSPILAKYIKSEQEKKRSGRRAKKKRKEKKRERRREHGRKRERAERVRERKRARERDEGELAKGALGRQPPSSSATHTPPRRN